MYIFISYSHKDEDYAARLQTELEGRGYPVWRDSKILPGDVWNTKIFEAINACKIMIVIMSPMSRVSAWVNREIIFGETTKKTQIPLLLAGEPFEMLIDVQYEPVLDGQMPSERFYKKLDEFYKKAPISSVSPKEKDKIKEMLVDENNRFKPIPLNDGATDDVREKIRLRLIELAKQRKTIEYKPLALEFGFRKDHDPKFTIPRIIGNISALEHEVGRPLLSVLIVGKESGIPGDGFYNLARYLKPEYRTASDMEILSEEMNAVFDYWENHDD